MSSQIEKRNILDSMLKKQMPALENLLAEIREDRIYEDRLYRFYHGSYKVYELQVLTEEIVSVLQSLFPEQKLNSMFMDIVHEGTGKTFAVEDNQRWAEATRPIVEAFLHSMYFLEMAVKYGRQPDFIDGAHPSGLAGILTLYELW